MISGDGQAVLAALAEGQRFRRGTSGGWRAGSCRAGAEVVEGLVQAALVRAESGELLLMPAGRAEAVRRRRPQRVLAERSLPDPGDGKTAPRRARRSLTVNLMESPLGWLKARGLITERQHDAGERLRADWTMAGLGPRVTMRWDAAPTARGVRGPDAPLDPTLAGIAAKRRFDEAITAAGSGLADVLWRVVCAGEGLEMAENALGWPRRAGKLVLLMALDRVADYYRLP